MKNAKAAQDGSDLAPGTVFIETKYTNRGKHYVRGHYSREDGRDGDMGYSSRRDSRGRYSREDGRDKMIDRLKATWDNTPEKDRQEFIRYLENA